VNKILSLVLLLSLNSAHASMKDHKDMQDDPLLTMVRVNQLEVRDADSDNPIAWSANGWLGHDRDKLWLKTEGEQVSGTATETEMQLAYSRAIAPFWDLQIGWRGNFRPTPERHWLALGFQGLAPYFFEIDGALFIGDHGRTALRVEAEYELLFSQRLILTPEIEVDVYGHNDPATATGSGLSKVSAGLRLRYEIRREFAPYIGIHHERKYGNTADYARESGHETADTQLVIGIRAWF